jgi:hypothetical protein
MKTAYAIAVVLRDADSKMQHYVSHCWATSQQEARGWAHERFDANYSGCKLLSLLIQEIVPDSDSVPVTPTHEYHVTHVQPEFTLKKNF